MSGQEAPRYAESIPTVTAPVQIPDLERMPHGWFVVSVIVGGVLAAAGVVAAVVGVVQL